MVSLIKYVAAAETASKITARARPAFRMYFVLPVKSDSTSFVRLPIRSLSRIRTHRFEYHFLNFSDPLSSFKSIRLKLITERAISSPAIAPITGPSTTAPVTEYLLKSVIPIIGMDASRRKIKER